MRPIFAAAFVAPAVAACAASALVPFRANAEPVDPGWQLAYPGQPGYDGTGGFTDETGQTVIAHAYQPAQTYAQQMPPLAPAYQSASAYYQPMRAPPPQPAYQQAPVYPRQASMPPQPAYQQAPAYYQRVPAPQASAQQPAPVYYQPRGLPAQPPPVYYQQAPAPQARAPQPTSVYYQQQPPAPQLQSSWHTPAAQPPGYGQQIYASAQPQQRPQPQPQPQLARGFLSAFTGNQAVAAPPQSGFQPPVQYPQAAPPQQLAFGYPAPAYVPSASGDMAHPMVDPMYDRQLVDYRGGESPGTIIVDTPHYFLYLVLAGGKALRYGIGVGRPGFTWAGMKEISAMREWPDWHPPVEMLERRPDLPRYLPGGPENPLGARALYLGSSLYRIHGSNEPWTIGTQVSSGCIRLRNDDIVDLYGRVKVGTKVIVI
jgi:lipoprotein-anchoring transpeptidase ErfK/SrfK